MKTSEQAMISRVVTIGAVYVGRSSRRGNKSQDSNVQEISAVGRLRQCSSGNFLLCAPFAASGQRFRFVDGSQTPAGTYGCAVQGGQRV